MQNHFRKSYLFFLGLLYCTVSFAQGQSSVPRSIHPMDLPITTNETSVLIFSTAIKSVDRGSRDVLTKTVKGVSNVLKLKAANDSMKPSNLHVFTADGQVYAFNITYNPLPPHLTIDLNNLTSSQDEKAPVAFTANRLNDAQVARYAALIAGLKPLRGRPRSKRIGGAQLAIQGAYFVKGVLFFQLSLVNVAPIPYQVDFTRTYVRDKRRSRRTSVTEKEIHPLYTHVENEAATGRVQRTMLVLAFDQFTIADNKHFSIEVFEQNGDRVLACKLKGKDILRAKKLSQDPVDNAAGE